MIAEFSDATKTKITGIFGSPQPIEVVPHQGEITSSDSRYRAWWDGLPKGTITGALPEPT